MNAHAPKVFALVAYEADALSPAGRRRVETHLAGCAECRETLAAMRVYEGLAQDVRDAEVPDLDWDRMELALRREARRASGRAGRGMVGPVAVALAVAAAVILGFFELRPQEGAPSAQRPGVAPDQRADRPPAPATERERITGTVMMAMAGATGGTEVLDPLVVGREITEGMRLQTREDALAHVRFYEGTGVVVRPGSAVGVTALRDGQVVLALEHGAVGNEVAPLGDEDVYVIRAGGYEARVRGTRFAVVQVEGGTAVTVDEGVVAVMRDDVLVETITAPGTWRSSPIVDPVELGKVTAPLALTEEATRWPVLRVSDVDWVTQWRIAGLELPAGEISMRVPMGEHDLEAFGAREQTWTARVVVGAEGHFIEPAAIRPSAPPVRTGHLDPSLIAPVVQRGTRGLERCQRQVDLDTGETVVGRFTLRVTIGRTGDVLDAALLSQGEAPPSAYRQCVLRQVRDWSFPAPTGGRVTFEQPLHVGTR